SSKEITQKFTFVSRDDNGPPGAYVDDTPTVYFPTNSPGREVETLLRQIVDSIAHYSEYRMVAAVLLPEKLTGQPQVIVCSTNVPDQVKKFLKEATFPVERLQQLVNNAVRIEIDELGFASYYPSTHHKHLKDLATIFNLFG